MPSKYLPMLALILPFEPIMSAKHGLEHKLKLMQTQVEMDLVKNYPADKAMPVIIKWKNLIQRLNFNSSREHLCLNHPFY